MAHAVVCQGALDERLHVCIHVCSCLPIFPHSASIVFASQHVDVKLCCNGRVGHCTLVCGKLTTATLSVSCRCWLRLRSTSELRSCSNIARLRTHNMYVPHWLPDSGHSRILLVCVDARRFSCFSTASGSIASRQSCAGAMGTRCMRTFLSFPIL